jgi:hypothetical protein
MNRRVELSDEERLVLLSDESLPKTIGVNGKEYVVQKAIATGFKGAVWRVHDEFGRKRALKLCPVIEYSEKSYLLESISAAKLEPYRSFASFVDAGVISIELGTLGIRRFVAFVEEWIDGFTLKEFLRSQRSIVNCGFLLAYVRGISSALSALNAVKLRHDDLHWENVMIARPAEGELSAAWTIRIVDMGSVNEATKDQKKKKDDHRHVVDHLVEIWNVIHQRKLLSARDRRFLRESEGLFRSMLDDDSSVCLREPGQIAEQFQRAFTRATASRAEKGVTPSSPFEFISAEHIADDKLLVEIFAQSCPFLEKVAGPDPCLVTGPRGCGKSTIFRWLSLKAHLHKPVEEFENFRIAGFYVSCSSDLQNRLGWIRTSSLSSRFQREIVHYFNMLFAREIAQTLSQISERSDSLTYFGFGTAEEKAVCDFLLSAIGPDERPRIQGVTRLMQALEVIENSMQFAHRQMLRGVNIENPTSEAFLGDLTSHLIRTVAFFRVKRPAFLVDDYSAHRIPEPVQQVLNRVIWERRSTHVFKLSSEKYGTNFTDGLLGTADVAREMVEIDCGREYIALDDSDQVERSKIFAMELLDNRLRASGYAGTAASLLGHSEWPAGSLARELIDKRPGRAHDQYHGLDCIAGVCSGDVSTLLLTYRRIFESGRVEKDTTTRVPKNVQHQAIVSVSRELLEAIKRYFPSGPEMHAVVSAFGALVRKILYEGRQQKKGGSHVPTQAPRIELDQKQGSAVDDLNEQQKEIARELVRRAIFIEMEPGLSRHQNMTTLRWHLRRVFLPAFGAALAKNDAVKQPTEWLKLLITEPKGACDLAWKKWPSQNQLQTSIFDQGDLLDIHNQ